MRARVDLIWWPAIGLLEPRGARSKSPIGARGASIDRSQLAVASGAIIDSGRASLLQDSRPTTRAGGAARFAPRPPTSPSLVCWSLCLFVCVSVCLLGLLACCECSSCIGRRAKFAKKKNKKILELILGNLEGREAANQRE